MWVGLGGEGGNLCPLFLDNSFVCVCASPFFLDNSFVCVFDEVNKLTGSIHWTKIVLQDTTCATLNIIGMQHMILKRSATCKIL